MPVPAVIDRMRSTLAARALAGPDMPALLMVSGGSDSTALAYLAAGLREAGELGPLAMLHVNHRLRGDAADADARFVAQLAELLGIPLFSCEIDIAREAGRDVYKRQFLTSRRVACGAPPRLSRSFFRAYCTAAQKYMRGRRPEST